MPYFFVFSSFIEKIRPSIIWARGIQPTGVISLKQNEGRKLIMELGHQSIIPQ